MKNTLNKGRCSRCIASKLETFYILLDENELYSIRKRRDWLKCLLKNNWCRNVALNCKESPMGISPDDYNAKIKDMPKE